MIDKDRAATMIRVLSEGWPANCSTRDVMESLLGAPEVTMVVITEYGEHPKSRAFLIDILTHVTNDQYSALRKYTELFSNESKYSALVSMITPMPKERRIQNKTIWVRRKVL